MQNIFCSFAYDIVLGQERDLLQQLEARSVIKLSETAWTGT